MSGGITPVRFRVTCCAWACRPDVDRLSPPITKPLVIDATSTTQAAKIAQQHGWRPAPGRGYWWCPAHAEASDNADGRWVAQRAFGPLYGMSGKHAGIR